MNKTLTGKSHYSAASRWRRQPIHAVTRLRCAIAMMILAFAVVLSALPSFAGHPGCDGLALAQQTTVTDVLGATSSHCIKP